MEYTKRQRVAVVGTGLAGLVASYLLSQDGEGRFKVEVFETVQSPNHRFTSRDPRSNANAQQGKEPSLDSATFSMQDPHGQCERRVDLPMRAFAGGFYRQLKAMYDYLDIQYQPQPFLFSFAKLEEPLLRQDGGKPPAPHFIHSSNNHRRPPVRPAQRGLLSWVLQVFYVTTCYVWFTICCFLVPSRPSNRDMPCESLRQYLHRIRLPASFVSDYLLPLICSVATCSHETLLNFPAQDLIEYKRQSQGAQHYVVSGGVHSVQRKLSKGLDMRFRTTVTRVENLDKGVRITWQERPGALDESITMTESFDSVILAVSPDIVARILPTLQKPMSQIPTTTVESVVQLDTTNATADTELRPSQQCQIIHLHSTPRATESIHSQPPSIQVTTCPITPITPSNVLHRARFTRVLRTPESRRIVNRLFNHGRANIAELSTAEEKCGWRNGDDGVWLVGGWCWDGMVLLEGCVVSAERVAAGMGVQVPWIELIPTR
jgi:NAD(P)-binding Rossmann-like domain/Flavin containing amine oxidoreductase